MTRSNSVPVVEEADDVMKFRKGGYDGRVLLRPKDFLILKAGCNLEACGRCHQVMQTDFAGSIRTNQTKECHRLWKATRVALVEDGN
jgi:hypothetical protein